MFKHKKGQVDVFWKIITILLGILLVVGVIIWFGGLKTQMINLLGSITNLFK